MATTIVPKPGKVARGVTAKQLQKQAFNWLQFAQRDLDKCDNMYDAEYLLGMSDAYRDVIWFSEQTPVNQLAVGRGKKLFALIPVAVVIGAIIHDNRKDKQPDA